MKRKCKSAKNPKPSKRRKLTKGSTTQSIVSGTGSFPANLTNIVSWNINGLRAAQKKPSFTKFMQQDFDIFCLNETKLQDKNISECSDSFSQYPYHYWNCSKARKGYAGTAIFSKIEPISVSNGIQQTKHDNEGRWITAEFDDFYVVSTYVPNSGLGGNLGRLDYRTEEWDLDLRAYLKGLEKTGKSVIWLGDLNVIHEDIDIHSIKGKEKCPGWTPAERASFASTLKSGFVDTFRALYPDRKQFSYYSTLVKNARERDLGWRLDYIVVSPKLMQRVQDSIIHDEVEASDHVPIQLVVRNSSEQETQTIIHNGNQRQHILSLPEDSVIGEFLRRPSQHNRSPYVADVWLVEEKREVIVHVPNLDMGGKMIQGARLLMKPARDKKGNLVGNEAVGPYGTPKCEFIAQLLYVDESVCGYEPAWVGAHGTLGEKIAESLISQNLLGPEFPLVESFKREVSNIGGTDMRADFLIQHTDPKLPPRVLEVKQVVDTDYSIHGIPDGPFHVWTSDQEPYVRTAIFPWGNNSNQKGPDGEKVVSTRAIKHVRELTRLAQGKADDGKQYDATVLFVVVRGDAKAFRPNTEACPSFTRYLKEAQHAGVQILVKQVHWGEDENKGKWYEGSLMDISWPKNN